MMGALVAIGQHGSVIWEFGAGVLAVYLVAAIVLAGITAIRRFLDQ
jgi:hypothetical protein